MTLLLGDVAVFFYFTCLMYCGNVRCHTLKDSYLETPKEGPPSTDDLDSCPTVNPSHPVLLPHPADCDKFYICDNGIRHLKECQPGLHFNRNIKACDYPNRAACESGNQEKPKGRLIGDGLNPCPAENPEYPIMLPHSEDCSKFYVCDNGNLILRECSPGLHFNQKIKACDYPDNAGCEEENTEKQKGKMIGNGNMCPSKNPSHPVMFPHPDDCSKYYVCDNGEALLRDCHPGLHYHAKIKACDYPKMAGCDADIKKDIKLESDVLYQDDICLIQMNGRPDPDFVPHSADCGKFFICNGGSKFPFTCPTGLHFNPMMNTCDFPESAKCDESANGVFTSSNDKSLENEIFYLCHENSQDFFPHPIYCEFYYFCDHGKAVLRKCPPGLNFNEELQVCDVKENKRCDKHMSTNIVGVPSPFCPSRNGKIPIFYRHSTNCSVYYMCGNGLAYEFVCPARLHFNVRKKVCDYERNAGCPKVNV